MESNSEAEADADEEDEEVASISSEKYKILSLEKMIAMVAILVEKSRDDSNALRLSANDWNALTGNDSFAFIVQQIRDSINLQSTRNLIFSMCRWNENLADKIVTAIFDEILKRPDVSFIININNKIPNGSAKSSTRPDFFGSKYPPPDPT